MTAPDLLNKRDLDILQMIAASEIVHVTAIYTFFHERLLPLEIDKSMTELRVFGFVADLPTRRHAVVQITAAGEAALQQRGRTRV